MSPYDPKIHNRRSIRLKGYDYASSGEYFLTLCLQNRACLLGDIKNGKMILNAAGELIDEWWQKITGKFPNSHLDVYQIMPNHFHALVGITDPQNNVGTDPRINPKKNPGIDPDEINGPDQGDHAGSPQPGPTDVGTDPRIGPEDNIPPQPDFEPRPVSIPGIIQWFKTMTTNKYIQGVKNGKFPPFDRKLWQRNYYDHIIRDQKSLERVQNYIINNPALWEEDRNHPGSF